METSLTELGTEISMKTKQNVPLQETVKPDTDNNQKHVYMITRVETDRKAHLRTYFKH